MSEEKELQEPMQELSDEELSAVAGGHVFHEVPLVSEEEDDRKGGHHDTGRLASSLAFENNTQFSKRPHCL